MTAQTTTPPQTLLEALAPFKRNAPPPGSPLDIVTLYSPIDEVHGALLYLIKSAQHSLVLAMYGFDDKELSAAMMEKLESEHVYVQLTLDSTQAAGIAEKGLVAQWQACDSNSVAVGRSERSAIMHRKMLLIDGIYLVTGSTNWSSSGESLQDNEMTVTSNPLRAAEARTIIDLSHQHMLKSGAAGQSVTVETAPTA